MRLARTRNREW